MARRPLSRETSDRASKRSGPSDYGSVGSRTRFIIDPNQREPTRADPLLLPSPSTPAPPSSSSRRGRGRGVPGAGGGPSGPGDPRARRSGCRRTRSGAGVCSVLCAGGSRGLRTGEARSCGRGLLAQAPRHGCALDDVSAVHRWSGAGASRAFLRST